MNIAMQRENALKALTESPQDVLIIGGGIVGAGIARDAAMRGLKVGLIEQHDFAFGTSSRSSRLLHGGMRYLAQGRIGLVREASVEKKIVHHIAPHLAEPLPFIFPTYRGNKNWVLWQLKIGVKIYDLLCGGRNLGKSTWLSKTETLEKIPGLAECDLNGAVRYYDGFTNDARLVLDTLRSAARSSATVVNYCRFQNANRATRSQDEIWECEIEDRRTQKTFTIGARTVINATGPWADGLPHSHVKLRITKGIHLVVARSKVPVPDTVVMTEGKRILFAIPWGERTILGTTDTDYTGSPDRVTADTADIGYVLQVTNQFFPNAKLSDGDVISTWAGLRPLIANADGTPSDISRSHQIRNSGPDWWDVAGGKLTTYRLMAEQTVDQIVKALRREGEPCRTAEEPLLPQGEVTGVSGIQPPEFSRRTVEHYVANEWAVHLDDVMVRRTSWHYYHRDAAQKAERAADWMGALLGWSDATRAAEITRYCEAVNCPLATKTSSSRPAERPNDHRAASVV
jgi:glycerol-3-phosphate dehydrogenase